MSLHTLAKLVRSKKRVGRGIGSRGAKSGRGQKGQKSRAGAHSKAGFEGGQTPLYMRLPKKRGSQQKFRSQIQPFTAINIANLRRFKTSSIVGPSQLAEAGLLTGRQNKVKLIGNYKLSKKLTVRVHAVSAQAQAAVEAAGGKVERIG